MKTDVSSRGRRPPHQEDKKKSRFIKWVLLILLLLFLVKGCYDTYIDKGQGTDRVVVGENFLPEGKDAQEMSDDDLMKRAQEAADKSNFNLMVFPKAAFSASTGEGTFKVKNPNANAYPINVDLINKSTGSIVYSSGAIYPGEEINKVKLDQLIEAGEYEMSAEVTVYNAETKLKQGIVGAEVSVVVKP